MRLPPLKLRRGDRSVLESWARSGTVEAEQLGYTLHTDSPSDVDHRFFAAGRGCHLLFRDYLRATPGVAVDSQALKYRLAAGLGLLAHRQSANLRSRT